MQDTVCSRPRYQNEKLSVVTNCNQLNNLYKQGSSKDAFQGGRPLFTIQNDLGKQHVRSVPRIRLLQTELPSSFRKEAKFHTSRDSEHTEREPSSLSARIHDPLSRPSIGNGYFNRVYENTLECRKDKRGTIYNKKYNALRCSNNIAYHSSQNIGSRYQSYLHDEGEDSEESQKDDSGHLKWHQCLASSYTVDEETKYENYDPDLMSADNTNNANVCHFGNISSKSLLKNVFSHFKKDCRCSAGMREWEDVLCGWDSKAQIQNYQKSIRHGKVRRSNFVGIPLSYQKLLFKDQEFDFQHFGDVGDYMTQYRYNHTVGDAGCPEEDGVHLAMPDPYISRIKSNAIADHFNILAISSLDKRKDSRDIDGNQTDNENQQMLKSDDESTSDGDYNLSVYDRGRGVNLAPVRRVTSRPRIKNKTEKPKRSHIPHSQYLNLVIPKTTLHRTNLQLNVTRDLGRAFESAKHVFVPYKPLPPRTSSADGDMIRRKSLDTVRNVIASPNIRPPNYFKLSRASTSVGHFPLKNGNMQEAVASASLPSHRLFAYPSSAGRISRNGIRTSENRTSVMLNEINEAYKRPSENSPEFLEGGDRLRDSNEKVVALTDPRLLRVRGKTCSEDGFSLAYKLKKGRQRRVGTSAVN